MLSTPAVPKALHQRESSRSNSTSSSSVVTTLQRTASHSSRPNSRQQQHVKGRPHTPTDSTPRSATGTPTGLADSLHRRGESETRLPRDNLGVVREGVGNLNRWSQSTGSSKNSATPGRGHTHTHSQSSRKSSLGTNNFTTSPKRTLLSKDRYSPSRPGASSGSAPIALSQDTILKPSMYLGGPLHQDQQPSTTTTNTSMNQRSEVTLDNLPSFAPFSPFEPPSPFRDDSSPPQVASNELLAPATYNASADRNQSYSRGASPATANRSLTPNPHLNPTTYQDQRRPSAESLHLHLQLDHDRPRSALNRRDNPSPAHSRQHSRHREDITKGSGDTVATVEREAGGSISSLKDGGKSRGQRQRAPSQKVMLSKALQKANTAVLLDNAHNFEGAIEAYHDACQLLQQVMIRSPGDDEKRKLEAIRRTYTTRIAELQTIDLSYQSGGKALPQRPMSDDSLGGQGDFMNGLNEEVEAEEDRFGKVETATPLRIIDQTAGAGPKPSRMSKRQSLLPSTLDPGLRFVPDPRESMVAPPLNGFDFRDSIVSPSVRDSTYPESYFAPSLGDYDYDDSIAQSMDMEYMPPPLSPRRPLSPKQDALPQSYGGYLAAPDGSAVPQVANESRETSTETTSWLDTIDESGDDSGDDFSASSVHSSQSFHLPGKPLRPVSSRTEAEFDAALDAAVEAAYDEGFEPADDFDENERYADYVDPDEVISNARRNVEMAKERVREAEREAAIASAKEREKWRLRREEEGRQTVPPTQAQTTSTLDFLDDEAEEEERLLDEMTRGYIMNEFEFDLGSKSALPRESDSSGFSGRTWGSSIGSNAAITAGTSLSTLAEGAVFPGGAGSKAASQAPPPPLPPPVMALPSLPPPPPPPPVQPPTTIHNLAPTSAPMSNQVSGVSSHRRSVSASGLPNPSLAAVKVSEVGGVRDRRLSGLNARQLKIETMPSKTPAAMLLAPSVSTPSPTTVPDVPPKPASVVGSHKSKLSDAQSTHSSKSGLNNVTSEMDNLERVETGQTQRSSTPVFTKPNYAGNMGESTDEITPMPSSPARLFGKLSTDALKKKSSASNLRVRNLSVSTEKEDYSPITPGGSYFPPQPDFRKPRVLPTPTGTSFTINGMPTGGLYLFESDIHSPTSPGSPNPLVANAPMPLEPCPESYLLRPFWLMRAMYQTIAHSKGGYLSTKLFVPRDVWRVKNVKIKNVEEKVANCDLLTAALLKLGQVDTLDADAVLEEMQSFEMVLDQVQTTLSKKLGNEVGLQHATTLFKGLSSVDEGGASDTFSTRQSTTSGKSYLTSWRKLRSKSSGAGFANTVANVTSLRDLKESVTMSSIPMTSTTYSRTTKRTPAQVQCTGPHANYMGALARLFDAAQILDQIARQVEDPGLKYSSQTHVGLELSTRHAAEFFGFYVCRFALNDVGMMLDKFLKRGTEWVMT